MDNETTAAPGKAFRVFSVARGPLRNVWCIVTDDHTGVEDRFGEAFLLTEHGDGFRAQRFTCDLCRQRRGLDGIVDLGATALEWAKQQVDLDLLEWHKHQPPGTPSPDAPEMTGQPVSSLVSLWLHGIHAKGLKHVADHTACKELQNYLGRVLMLPPVVGTHM